jgi:hypothetical protein
MEFVIKNERLREIKHCGLLFFDDAKGFKCPKCQSENGKFRNQFPGNGSETYVKCNDCQTYFFWDDIWYYKNIEKEEKNKK